MGERDRNKRWESGSYMIDLYVRMPDGSSVEFKSKKGARHSPEMVKHAAAIAALWLGLDEKQAEGLLDPPKDG